MSYRFITVIITWMVMVTSATSQSNWVAGNIYNVRGDQVTTCGLTYNVTCWDAYARPYVCGQAQNCRTLYWEQRYYAGYVYFWGSNGWYTEWQEGYFWSCYWNDWVNRLW